MPSLKIIVFTILACSLLLNCAQISIGQNDAQFSEKKKIYCNMISYHFLDDHNSVFQSFTSGMTSLKTELFKNKVARKLSENCQQKITTQQLVELSKLLEHISGHQKEIFDLQNKYIQYFTPQNGIVLKLLEQVKEQSDSEARKQIEKFHQARKSIEHNSKIVIEGFKQIQKNIDQKGRFMVDSMHHISSLISDIHSRVTQTYQKIKSHPDIKKIKQFVDQL